MNVIKAAEETLEVSLLSGYDIQESDVKELDYPHIVLMIERMKQEEMSEDKKNRWLGWI